MTTIEFVCFVNYFYDGVGMVEDEQSEQLKNDFEAYLQEKFKDKPEKLKAFSDISLPNVLMRLGHPFYHGGYHPATYLHFAEFIKQKVENT